MSPTTQCDAEQVLRDTLGSLACGSDSEALFDRLRSTEPLLRAAERMRVEAVADLLRQGAFAARGYRNPVSALCAMFGIEHREALQLVTAAESVCVRSTLQGEVLPPELPALASVFAAGSVSVGHVAVAAAVLASRAAERLSPSDRAEAERLIAAAAPKCTPKQLRRQAVEIVELLDQDGPEPDDRPVAQVNELRITRLSGGGGRIAARIEDPVRFETFLAVVDSISAPRTADDQRTTAERKADALVDVCGFVAEHGDKAVLPDAGGRRPQVSMILRHDDLARRGRGGWLSFGGTPTPESLRMLCCDARILPVVLGGAGQPLDVGRRGRTIPPAIRTAVEVRDRGCAHPGCDRPPSWSEVHHVIHWAHGGSTSVGNCVMLCHVHHREIHSTEWEVRIPADGIPEFIPPPWIDPSQTPRRQPRHDLDLVR
jgi:Domain of unknown function (DUF222)/HNH endonuclease